MAGIAQGGLSAVIAYVGCGPIEHPVKPGARGDPIAPLRARRHAMPIRTTESWMLRFASNHLAAERDDEQFELVGATLTDEGGVQGMGWTFTSDYGGGRNSFTTSGALAARG